MGKKITPAEHPEYKDEHVEGKVAEPVQRWFEKDLVNVDEIPIVGRPRGKGTRLDFYTETQFPDMALEIKEASPKNRFKNTNDVHRAAHYIGMYLLRQKAGSVPKTGIGRAHYQLDAMWSEVHEKRSIEAEFLRALEAFCTGGIEKDAFIRAREILISNITNEDTRRWAIKRFSAIESDENAYTKIGTKLRVREHRAKQKELGLKVVGGEDEE